MWYFAYGSNMKPARMKEERGVGFSRRIHAILKGYELEFNKVASCNPTKKGYANIVPNEKTVVEGALYEITDSDLKKLKKYEGYPDHYDIIEVTVQLDNSDKVEAITFTAQKDNVKEGLRPSKKYLNHLLVGGKNILSKSYYDKLASQETLDD